MNGTKIDMQLAKLQQQIEAEHSRFAAAVFNVVETMLIEYGLSFADLSKVKVYASLAKKMKVAGIEVTPDVARELKALKVTKATKATKAKKPATSKGTRPPKYRDPESGKTWSGMGHTPQWMVNAKNRDAFLIN